jgi:hypothetical protein
MTAWGLLYEYRFLVTIAALIAGGIGYWHGLTGYGFTTGTYDRGTACTYTV